MTIERARVPLSRWQQAAVAMGSAVGALVNPRRADLIAALGETTGKPAFEMVLERMKKSPEGRLFIVKLAREREIIWAMKQMKSRRKPSLAKQGSERSKRGTSQSRSQCFSSFFLFGIFLGN
ncbi:unnamed protein product [Microthlaspi erraticum]|uniref:Ubiquinone biosynthesis protein n=1 Tax=Microthlaspi erraticum TaxID=1685480 RepID=A0A6D2L4S8_9BRAS|nr:unnamed protein product [Microthlaspi erraticum]